MRVQFLLTRLIRPVIMTMIIFGCWQWPQRNDLAGIDDLRRAALHDGLVDRGLEVILIDHQARSSKARDLSRRELQVVRLRTWRSQTGNRCMVARDALGDKTGTGRRGLQR